MAKKTTRSATKRVYFTERRLEALDGGAKRAVIYDGRVRELGLKVESGKKVFFWFRSVPHENAPDRAGRPCWKTIGPWPDVALDDARLKAAQYNALLANWRKDGCKPPDPFRVQPTSTVPTFGELVEAYILHHLRDATLHPVTAELNMRYVIKKYFTAWLARPLDTITVADVLAAKQVCGRQKYAANGVVEMARRLFNWCAGRRDGKVNFWPVAANPAASVSVHEIRDRQRRRFLQPAELVRFNEELEKEQHRDLRDVLVLLLATGARKGNVYEMRWQDISFDLARWNVPTSKSGEGYQVNLTPAAVKVLERRRRAASPDDMWIFPANSKSGHIVDVKKVWMEFRKRCGFPDVRLHDLRRTRGSYLAIGGVSLQQIGAALGHKSMGSTAIYARLHDEAIAKALTTGDATMARMMAQSKKRTRKELPAPKP